MELPNPSEDAMRPSQNRARRRLLYCLVVALAGIFIGPTAANPQPIESHDQLAQRRLTYRDILGRWCGQVSTYVLSRNLFILRRYSDNREFRFRVRHYSFTYRMVVVHWTTPDGKQVRTKFTNMRPMGPTFYQPKGKYTYRRC
jgi:hypothetical protein